MKGETSVISLKLAGALVNSVDYIGNFWKWVGPALFDVHQLLFWLMFLG